VQSLALFRFAVAVKLILATFAFHAIAHGVPHVLLHGFHTFVLVRSFGLSALLGVMARVAHSVRVEVHVHPFAAVLGRHVHQRVPNVGVLLARAVVPFGVEGSVTVVMKGGAAATVSNAGISRGTALHVHSLGRFGAPSGALRRGTHPSVVEMVIAFGVSCHYFFFAAGSGAVAALIAAIVSVSTFSMSVLASLTICWTSPLITGFSAAANCWT